MTANTLSFRMLLYMQKDYDRLWIWISFIRRLKKQKKEFISDSEMQKSSISDWIVRQRSNKTFNEIHNETDEISSRIHNETNKVPSEIYDEIKLHCRILDQKTWNKNHNSLTRKSNIIKKNVSATIVTILII